MILVDKLIPKTYYPKIRQIKPNNLLLGKRSAFWYYLFCSKKVVAASPEKIYSTLSRQ
jgi:hypothetical protein